MTHQPQSYTKLALAIVLAALIMSASFFVASTFVRTTTIAATVVTVTDKSTVWSAVYQPCESLVSNDTSSGPLDEHTPCS